MIFLINDYKIIKNHKDSIFLKQIQLNIMMIGISLKYNFNTNYNIGASKINL